MESNAKLKRKYLFALNQDLLRQLKVLKQCQEMLLIALNDGIKCAFKGEDKPRQEIANIDYKRALNIYIDNYCEVLKIRESIEVMRSWNVEGE